MSWATTMGHIGKKCAASSIKYSLRFSMYAGYVFSEYKRGLSFKV